MKDLQPARRTLYQQQSKKEATFDVLAIARTWQVQQESVGNGCAPMRETMVRENERGAESMAILASIDTRRDPVAHLCPPTAKSLNRCGSGSSPAPHSWRNPENFLECAVHCTLVP